ncbi:MAG: hypothetical protein Q7K35_05535 [bacterium]|nr:hypothetical protein [bacterium]
MFTPDKEKNNAVKNPEKIKAMETKPETVELPESIPTPEEIYAQKLNMAAGRVSRVIDAQRVEELQASLAVGGEQEFSAPKPPLLTLRALFDIERQNPKGIFKSLKDKVQGVALRMKGAQNPEQFAVFSKYLEHNLTETKECEAVVDKTKEKETRQQLSKSGRTVRRSFEDFQDKEKACIKYEEKVPFHIRKKQIEQLDALLGKANDPVEIMERLQRLGFGINGHTFEYQADTLQGFIENSQIPQMLKLLQELGVKSQPRYFGKSKEQKKPAERNDVEEVEAMAGNQEFLSAMTPEVVAKMRALTEKTKLSLSIDKEVIEALFQIAKDPQMEKVFSELAVRDDTGFRFGEGKVPLFIRQLKKENLTDPLARMMDVVSASELLPGSLYGTLENEEKMQKSAEEVRLKMNSEFFKNLMDNPAEFEHLRRVSILIGCRLDEDSIKALNELNGVHPSAKEETMVMLSAMHESGVKLNRYNFKSCLEVIRQILTDKKAMERFLDPGFNNFLTNLCKASGQPLTFYDFRPGYSLNALTKLYDDQEARDLILSDRGAQLLKVIGKFDTDKIETYNALANVDGMPELISQLKAVYGYKPDQTYSLSTNHLTKLAQDAELKEKLFSEATVNFFEKLRKEYQLEFFISEVDELVALAEDSAFREKLESPANAEFIKTVGAHSVEKIKSLVNMDDKLKPVLSKLKIAFGYRVDFQQQGTELNDEKAVSSLAVDAEGQNKLFAPDIVARINRLKKFGYFYEISVSNLHKLSEVPDDTVAFIEQLSKRSGYSFRLADLPDIEKRKTDEKIFGILDVLKDFNYKFELFNFDTLSQLEKYPSEVIRQKLSLFKEFQQEYQFSSLHIDALITCIENNFTATDLADFDALDKKYLWQDHTMEIHSIPNLAFLRDHEKDIAKTIKQLEDCGMHGSNIYAVGHGERLQIIHDRNLFPQFKAVEGDAEMQFFIYNNTERIAAIEPEKRQAFIDIVLAIRQSPSQEIKRIQDQLTTELLKTDDPVDFYRQIEDIFIKNNLPTVGKIYKIFETLYSPSRVKRDLGQHNGSPLLESASARKRGYMIYQDLLRTHIRSGNRSLRSYAEVLEESEPLLIEADRVGVDKLDEDKRERLSYLLAKFNTLYVNSALGKHTSAEANDETDLKVGLNKIKQNLEVRERQSITQRVAEMYLKPIGLSSVSEMLEEMKTSKKKAHERGLQYAQESAGKPLELKSGDLLKGVDDRYIGSILQNGSVSKEFLGSSSSQDATPFDTDVSMVLPQDAEGGFAKAVQESMASGYGRILFAVKDRSQFNITRQQQKKQTEAADPSKLELFETGGGRHYGIRTGFPTTEIDFMIVQDSLFRDNEARSKLNNLYFEIAQNGYYIPVTDDRGNVIFTPENYQGLRKSFDGLERFDGDPLPVVENNPADNSYKEVFDLATKRKESQIKIMEIEENIRGSVKRALAKNKIKLRSKYDTSILGADLVETGSIGRQTNLDGDFDFDFALKLDAKDFPKSSKIAEDLKMNIVMAKDNSHLEQSGYYQLRAEGVTRIGDTNFDPPISVDIGFADRSELAVFDTQEALEERYEYIRQHNGQDAHEQVLANIVLAKKILKEAKAYKKLEDGGLGGVGLENWILANGGNIAEAFKSFLKTAKKDGQLTPLDEFKENYKIIDPGVNIKKHRHDDFVRNLTEQGYAKMVEAIENYLNR